MAWSDQRGRVRRRRGPQEGGAAAPNPDGLESVLSRLVFRPGPTAGPTAASPDCARRGRHAGSNQRLLLLPAAGVRARQEPPTVPASGRSCRGAPPGGRSWAEPEAAQQVEAHAEQRPGGWWQQGGPGARSAGTSGRYGGVARTVGVVATSACGRREVTTMHARIVEAAIRPEHLDLMATRASRP